jgi:hypothetical protein
MYRGSLSDDGFDDLDAGDIGGGRHATGGWRSRHGRHDDYDDDEQGDLTSYLRPVTSRRPSVPERSRSTESSRFARPSRIAASSRLPRPPRLALPTELSEYAGYAVLMFIAVAIVMIFIVLLLNR